MALTPKQLLFVKEYLIDFNATQAAIRAGYSKKTARSQGQRLLTNVDICTEIQKSVNERAERTEVTADRVVLEYARIAFLNPAKFFTMVDDTVLLDFNDCQEDEIRAIAEIQQEMYVEKDGTETGQTVKKTKLKFHNKLNALDALAKHTGVYERDEEREKEEAKEIIKEALEEINQMSPEERREQFALLNAKRAG